MAIKAIAAGDSLICEAVVPAELGAVSEALFEAAAQRHGPVARRISLPGAIVAVDSASRVVRVAWPFGQLSAGVWRVQIRATTVERVWTFILDQEVAVEVSLLPPRAQVAIVRIGLPRLRVAATGKGGGPPAILNIRLPRLGLAAQGAGARAAVVSVRLPKLGVSARGAGARPTGIASLRLPRLGLTASGSARAQATATARLPQLRIAAEGSGVRPQAEVTVRLPRLGMRATGVGGIGAATAVLRLPRLRVSAEADPLIQSTLLGSSDDALLLGWEDDAPLEVF